MRLFSEIFQEYKSLSKLDKQNVRGILWSYALLLMLPSLLPATFLHEMGHAIIGMLLFPNHSSSINYLIGFYNGGGKASFWWQDVLSLMMGIIISTITLVITIKKVIPRIPVEKYYLRICIQIFSLSCWVMGPMYLAGAFFLPFTDVTIPAQAFDWVLGTIGIKISTKWILTFVGVIISIYTMKKLAGIILSDIKYLLNQFSNFSFSNKIYSFFSACWVIIVLLIMLVYRLLATYLLQNTFFETLERSWRWVRYDITPILQIFATFLLIGFLFIVYYVNKRVLSRISKESAEKNLKIFTLILLFIIPVYFTQQILLRDPDISIFKETDTELPPMSTVYDMMSYYPSTQESPYLLTLYRNNSYTANYYQNFNIYGLALQKFNPINNSYLEPVFLLQNLTRSDQISTMEYIVDNSNRCWLASLDLIDNAMNALPESRFRIRRWQLYDQNFSNTLISPDEIIDLNFLNINITNTFQYRMEFDEVNNALWLFCINTTLSDSSSMNFIDDEGYTRKTVVCSLNLSNMEWNKPMELNSTVADRILANRFDYRPAKLIFHSNFSLGFYEIRFNSVQYYQSASLNLTDSWNIIEHYEFDRDHITLNGWIMYSNQILLLYHQDRELWVRSLIMNNPDEIHISRVTWDYPENSGNFIRCDNKLFILDNLQNLYQRDLDSNNKEWAKI